MNRANRPRLSRISGSSYASKLLGRAGDGSTLTLDFTTGQLDPRLTFTRASNATFINSSGLVEWASVNEFRNTGWVTSTTPAGWNVTFGTGTTTWNNDGTVTMNTGGSSTRPCINANSFTVSQGIAYTCGYTVVSASGSPQISSVISSTVAGETFAINGATVSGTTVVQAGDIVSCTFTPTGTTSVPRMGPGVNFGMTNTAMTITRPQMNPGVRLQPYLANSSTTAANNNTPRFDYDPTTLAPRGLLIEATATNLAPYSNLQLGWAGGTNTTLTPNTTEVLSPDGTNNAAKIALTSTGYCSRFESITGLANATTYTFSYWIRGTAGNQQRVYSVTQGADLVTQSTLTYTSTGWTRVQITFTSGAANNNVYVYVASRPTGTVNDVLYIYGCQLEAGSGASSLIPTGASTVQRLADSAVMNDIASLAYSATNGSIYWSGIINKQPTSYITLVGFMTAIDQPAYETFGNALNYFTAARGPTLNIGGANEVSRPYVLGSLIKYASSVNTLQDPIVAVNLNGSASSTNKSGTGDLRVATRFVIGRQPSSTYGAEYPSVTIRSIKYWPTSKVAAELAVLTA